MSLASVHPPPARPRRVLLADADAFFVAVARQTDPEGTGRTKLLLVGGSAKGRGVVTSASYEARAFGVRSGMPMARAVRLCPQATVVPVPRGVCSARSREIRGVLERFAPLVASGSIDEWYMDMGGTESMYRNEPLADTARRMRGVVHHETGLDVSIGGGTSRLVAKLAVEVAKPRPGSAADGVHVVPAGEEARFLTRFDLADFPQVGPRLQEQLHRVALRTVPDALAAGRETLVRLLGERAGRWLHERIQGIDTSPVESRGQAKSISRDETFARDLHDDASLESELWMLVLRACADLRHSGLHARTVTVRIRDADFTTRQASHTLPEPVETDHVVGAVARALLARLRRQRRVGARLIGVGLSQLVDARDAPGQLTLFPDAGGAVAETERDRVLARALDAVRDRFGAESIVPGAAARRATDGRAREAGGKRVAKGSRALPGSGNGRQDGGHS